MSLFILNTKAEGLASDSENEVAITRIERIGTMKILTKKKTKAIFNDMMTLTIIASESTRMLAMGEQADPMAMLKQQERIIDLCGNIAYSLRGMYGMFLASNIQNEYNERRLKQMEKDVKPKKDPCEGCYYALNHECKIDIKGYCPREEAHK